MVLSHRKIIPLGPAKLLHQGRINPYFTTRLIFGGLKGRPGPIPGGFESFEPVLQEIIKVCEAFLDQLVQAPKLVVGVGDFPL